MPKIIVFKGGTAFNYYLPSFNQAFPKSSYVLPVSDDGGSSREITRVLGGPSIGDIRSTLTRLSEVTSSSDQALKSLLEFRLDAADAQKALQEWQVILSLQHPLWEKIKIPLRGLVHRFLSLFEEKRLCQVNQQFDLCNGSIGNFFFTGARLFFGSLTTPIFIYSSVVSIPMETEVLPIFDCDHSLALSAILENGETLYGQSSISHPGSGCQVLKEGSQPLQSRVKKVAYLDGARNVALPKVNPAILSAIRQADLILYGVGSLWTSIVPCLIPREVAGALIKSSAQKVLMLNTYHDRETMGLDAGDFITTIQRALGEFQEDLPQLEKCVTHLLYTESGEVSLGRGVPASIKCIQVAAETATQSYTMYDAESLESAIRTILSTRD